jgi:acetyl-CoA decarbonylase/synthase complex subunit delta
MLQMPIVTPVGGETWVVKESTASEEDIPEWGAREERGIEMEVSTAAACITGGSNAVFMRHPEAVKTIANLVSALM